MIVLSFWCRACEKHVCLSAVDGRHLPTGGCVMCGGTDFDVQWHSTCQAGGDADGRRRDEEFAKSAGMTLVSPVPAATYMLEAT